MNFSDRLKLAESFKKWSEQDLYPEVSAPFEIDE